jgi:phosphoglycerate dehydrogenase-like enzyme
LTSKTKNLFDKNIFNRMNKKCFFLNISRDQTIKISDLKKVVNEKKFLGIGIDNTGSFKMNKKIIYDSKSNFVLTDHQAGISTNLDRKKKLIFENLKNYYLKKKMNFLVSKEREY